MSFPEPQSQSTQQPIWKAMLIFFENYLLSEKENNREVEKVSSAQ